MKKWFLYIVIIFTFSGCSGGCLDWVNPDTSKAISEKEQLEESKKQTIFMERQAIALESIAKSLKKLETK